MYKMKADGVVFYDPSADDLSLHVLSPKASYELNKAGSLKFTVLPGNVMYNQLHKLKTVVTLEQDDEIIFCGRVLETVTDLYNRKEVYCEGELAFLLDSLVRPYDFDGPAPDLFRQLVTEHNQQVEEYKRFQVGTITAVKAEDESKVEGDSYTDTLSEIKSLLLDEYGGYLRVRRENGVRYLDYLDKFEQACSQSIDFGVNLLDIENKINVQELCTVLVPLGKHKDGGQVTIKDENDGKDYIEDADGIASYGRIIKTHTWEEVEEPAELLSLGQEYMEKMKADTTLTITALDLRTCGADVDGIHLGDTVHLHSIPHGLDKDDICAAVELDIEKPEKSEYTFGLPRETLTRSHANTAKKFSSAINDQHRWLTETNDALNITVEAVNLIGHRTTTIEGDFNAMKGEIALKASQEAVDVLGQSVNAAEARISSAEAAISLKASQTTVDELGEQVSAAELRIDGMDSTITLQAKEISAKADRIDLAGYVTMDEFETVTGWADDFASARIETPWLEGGTVNADSVIAPNVDADVVEAGVVSCDELNGAAPKWTGGTVLTGIGTISQSKRFLNVMLADGSTAQLDIVTDVSITPSSAYIEYLGKG